MIIYSKDYNPKNTRYRAWHHTGGLGSNSLASTQHLTADDVNAAHYHNWNFKSEYTGLFGGYNFFIDKDGIVTQFRAIGEETAANRGYNFNGELISICLAGNFSRDALGHPVDFPIEKQIEAARKLHWEIPPAPNKPHRYFNDTECYGRFLTDDWIENALVGIPAAPTPGEQSEIAILRQIVEKLKWIIDRLKIEINKGRLGSDNSCSIEK